MYSLNSSLPIEYEDVEHILKPIFRQTRELLQLPIPLSLEQLSLKHELDMIEKYDKEATKIFQITPKLVGRRNLIENYMTRMHIDENDERVINLKAKIDLFIQKNILLKIEVPQAKIQLSPDFKLLITPLGIVFLHRYYSKSFHSKQGLNFNDVLFEANQMLGSVYNQFIVSRISDYLDQAKSNLTKREIVLTLFLILSQAISPDRAIKVGKPANGDLLVPLKCISKAVFTEEAQLFPDKAAVDNAIRRSTGATGLQGKTSMLFVKKEIPEKRGYLLYFRLEKERENLSFIIHRLFESIKSFEEKEGYPYRERIMKLVDKHLNDRNLIFESKPYVRQKILLNPGITTDYLRSLFRTMKGFYN